MSSVHDFLIHFPNACLTELAAVGTSGESAGKYFSSWTCKLGCRDSVAELLFVYAASHTCECRCMRTQKHIFAHTHAQTCMYLKSNMPNVWYLLTHRCILYYIAEVVLTAI